MSMFPATRRFLPRFLLVAASIVTVALAAACGVGGGPARGHGAEPPGEGGQLRVDVRRDYEAGGLVISVHGITVRPDRVLVDMTVRNLSQGPRALLLGGCGPSQGAVSTKQHRYEMYYRNSTGDDLTRGIAPGATKSTQVTLMFKSGEIPNPDEATQVEFHPGYILDPATGQLEYAEIEIPLRP